MRIKYNAETAIDCLKAMAYDSSLWKDIARSLPILLDTSMWIMGDGKSIKAWEDNWLGKEYCLNNYDVCILHNLRGVKVCDLVNDRGEWNVNLLSQWLLYQWVDKLQSCVPRQVEPITDVFCLAGINRKKFSVKTMYQDLKEKEKDVENENWIGVIFFVFGLRSSLL